MTYYFYWHFLLSLGLWSCAIICSLGSRDDPELHSVVAPRLFSIGYPYGLETNERSNLGPRPQTETQILDFVRERHSKNHEDSRSDSINIFYDSVGGTDVIDAWIARLTDEDILEFQESFLGILIGVASFDTTEQQGSLRKRAGNESCDWIPPTVSTSSATDLPSEPSFIDEDVRDDAATALPLNDVRPCLDECRSIFSKCTIDFEPVAEDRRRDVKLIDCQAAGNCYCAETPWRTGSPLGIDFDKADKICSDTCTSIGRGTQIRQNAGTQYNFKDLQGCLEQAEGGKLPGEAQPAGCMGA